MINVNETTLVDEFGDDAALSVNLEELATAIKSEYPDLAISTHYEDYDDYGCENYILIEGVCASITIQKNYGGMFCPDDFLECFVQTKSGEDYSSRREYKHEGVMGGIATHCDFYEFLLKNPVESYAIHNKYGEKINKWLDENIKYLSADSSLFLRKDSINYADLRGQQKWGNGITSFDSYIVADNEFYTSKNISHSVERKLVTTEEGY